MLLGGMSRHISFGWANALQSLLFASIHGDPPRFLVYAALGWLAGWLTRRYGTLLPAIALHALNNAMATWVIS
jgi:membrane protease YdiL (CAAX protease family)